MIATSEPISVSLSDLHQPDEANASFPASLLEETSFARAVPFPSARDALVYAFRDLGLKPNDEVLIPSYTCRAVLESVKQVATPNFVNINSRDFNIDLGEIGSSVTERTEAIVPVHMYGCPVDMDAVSLIADQHDLVIIEDAAQSLGATFTTDRVGTFSDYCVYSFRFSKEATCYKGGLLLSNESSVAQIEPAAQFQTAKLAVTIAFQSSLASCPGPIYKLIKENFLDPLFRSSSEKVDGRPPRSFSERQRLLMECQLSGIAKSVETRRTHARRYNSSLPATVDTPKDNGDHTYFRFPIRVPANARDELYAALHRRGVGCSKMYAYTLTSDEDYSNAQRTSERIITLPISADMTEDQIVSIISIFNEVWDSVCKS